MTSILQSSLSPTQQLGESKFKTKTITGSILDDNYIVYPIEITYDYFFYAGFKMECIVTGFDRNLSSEAKISKSDLQDEIIELIKNEERCPVYLEY